MSNFASKPEIYGKRYDPIFESSLQSPISDKDKLQYFRSMFDDDVRSYLTDEDREEIYAKTVEMVARKLKENNISLQIIASSTGLSVEEIQAL